MVQREQDQNLDLSNHRRYAVDVLEQHLKMVDA